MLCGLAGSCISLLLFGFSPNFYWALAARALSEDPRTSRWLGSRH